MLNHFPDPDLPDFRDARLNEDVRTVPPSVIDAYGLGNATISALETGSYNIHFKVEMAGSLFDLRRSNRPCAPGNLRYEASILEYLRQNGFHLAPEIVSTRSGEPDLWVDDAGWTLFRWMGDGPGTNRQTASAQRTLAAARVLARFHSTCRDFTPTTQRGQWPIFTLSTADTRVWLQRAESLADALNEETTGPGEPVGGGDDMLSMARQSAAELASVDHATLPEFMCHGDYRMKNIQFTGDEITGVFDIDTSLRASRLLDLGGAVTRFSPLGGNPQADVESGALFLREYHEHLRLTDYEIEVLPIFIRWRLLRDVVIYYDRWWCLVRETCTALFAGAANEIVTRANLR